MDLTVINNLLNKTFDDLTLEYIGIFVKGKLLTSRQIHKTEKLGEHFSKLIEKSLEINEAIKDFNAEFLVSEGKDYSIMVYYLSQEIAIGIIRLGKPNFSLLKVGAQDLAKDLKKYEKEFLDYYEKYLKPKEEEKSGDVQYTQEKSKQKEEINYSDNISELEKVLSSNQETNSKEEIDKIPSLEDILTNRKEIQEDISLSSVPSLEEILTENSETIEELAERKEPKEESNYKESVENIDEVLDNIEKEFIKVLGPFGKFLMKKKKEDFFKTKDITKYSVLKFIHNLAEEIPETKKREVFIENTKRILLNL